MRNLLLGAGASLAYGIIAVVLARFWSVPLAVYLAPAAVVDHPIGALLSWIARRIVPQGGAPGVFLLVMGTDFIAWSLVFALIAFLVRRRVVAVV